MIQTGFPFKSSSYSDDPSGPKLLRGDNVAQGQVRWDGVKRWPPSETNGLEQYWLEQGDVILAMDRPWIEAGLKYCVITRDELPCLLVQRVARLRGQERLDTGFLKYVIGSLAFTQHVLAVQTGTAVPHISTKQIQSFKFDLPPLPEQRAIAATLGALDDKIELNRRMNETLETMARALFRDWFVDFGPTRAKMAGAAPYLAADLWSLFPDRLDDEGKPEGWNETTIGNALERLKVGRLYDQKSALLTGIVPILDQGKSGSIGFHNNEPNIRADAESRVCTFSNHTCVLRLIDFDFSTIQNVIPFRGKGISTEWLYYASLGRQKFEEYRGHWPSFVEHKITAPPSKLANVFCDIVAPMVNAISQNGRESRTLAQTRDLLLPRLMSGELRIAEAERMLEEVA